MKLLLIKNFVHPKILFALNNYKNIALYETDNIESVKNLEDYDYVYSPSQPIDVSLYPNTNFIFGPHFSVFPDSKYEIINHENAVYNVLCDWNYNIYSNDSLTKSLKLVTIPFGIDTEQFCEIKPIETRSQVFIYYKCREPYDLDFVKRFLNSLNIDYRIFDYMKRYDENEYIEYLQNSKFGIWIGRHETQGFALREALSCNVPLLVWNVRFMSQEYESNYNDIPVTSIPYWDERCGDVFYDTNELEETFGRFNSNLCNYRPREFILENSSLEVCENKLLLCKMDLTIYLTECVINNKPVAFSKYGDGELNCMMYSESTNCDNDYCSNERSIALIESFQYMVNEAKNSYIGMWHGKSNVSFLEDLVNKPIKWAEYHSIIIDGHDMEKKDDKLQRKMLLYKSIKDSKRKKIIICNGLLIKSKELLNIDFIIQIPLRNWYDTEYQNVLSILNEIIKEDGNHIVITCCGITSKILLADIMRKFPNGIYLDFGSALDYICTKKCSRGNTFTYEDLISNLNEIIPDDWENEKYNSLYACAQKELGIHLPKLTET